MNYGRVKHRVFTLLSPARDGDLTSRSVDVFLVALIALNVAAAILQTVEAVYVSWQRLFDGFELLSVIIFSAEYVLRIWSCTSSRPYRHGATGRLRYALTPLLVIDLLAVAPFYLSAVITLDLRMLRAVRLIRLLRVLRIARYTESLQLLGRVFLAKRSELLITLTAVGVLLIVASTLMYYVERDAQPEEFSSIPAAMWWGVATLTTVGYGDLFPITAVGKVVGALIAVLGIGLFALPAGILASGLVEELQGNKSEIARCPHCGRRLDGRAGTKPKEETN